MDADPSPTCRRHERVIAAYLASGIALVLALGLPGLLARAPAPPSVSAPELRRAVRWHPGKDVSAAFSAGGKFVALGDATGLIQVRRLPDGKLLETIRAPRISGRVPSSLT